MNQYAIRITGKDQVEIDPDMPVPEVGPTQILLQIEACGICFSDTKLMHAFDTHPRKTPIRAGLTDEELAQIPTYRPGSAPVVPGHEPVARVAAVGEKVTRYHPGQRVLVQTDYRHLPTEASNAAFGYDFDGALEEYALVDEKMVIDPVSQESYLINVGEDLSSAAVALVEPWACVETAYAWGERQSVKQGGSLLAVIEEGMDVQGLDDIIRQAKPGSVLRLTRADQIEAGITFDDIIYAGTDPSSVERLAAHLGKQGILNVVTCGRRFGSEVRIDAGRVHYDLIRYVGTTSDRVQDGYSWIPAGGEVRDGDRVAVIGAAGPMGLMHAVRTATCGVAGVTLDAVDIDDERLARLHDVLDPIAQRHEVPVRVINSARSELEPHAYTYVALMVASPAQLQEAVRLAGEGAIVNAFAGFAVGTMVPLDLTAVLDKDIFITGTSGSRIADMVTVVGRLEAGTVDTTVSLDAITGMAGVPDALESVNKRTSQGKIMVYPKVHGLGLIRLCDLPERLPEVAAAMDDGRWTKKAEQVLLDSAHTGKGKY